MHLFLRRWPATLLPAPLVLWLAARVALYIANVYDECAGGRKNTGVRWYWKKWEHLSALFCMPDHVDWLRVCSDSLAKSRSDKLKVVDASFGVAVRLVEYLRGLMAS